MKKDKLILIALVFGLLGCQKELDIGSVEIDYLASEPPPDWDHLVQPIDNRVTFDLFFGVRGVDEHPLTRKQLQE